MDTWKFIAGLGLFLFGMTTMERVLKNLSGRSFKLFLGKYTQSLPKAIAGGALITGLVQSSTVVSLLILAFVEAGTITFRNALGVILGSNVGTTLTSWIVATVAFRLDIESYALPVVGLASIGMFFSLEQKRLNYIFRLLFSFGILFLGLGFMKTSAEHFVGEIDLAAYGEYGLPIFAFLGFVITLLIQASSATVAITLTALYTHAISFPDAAAIVIGSELGTTIKIVMAGSSGSADKKRVAWGNFTFNLVTCVVVFILLPWIIHFIQDFLKIKDPLIGLVFLQTAINVLSIIIFLPFIDPFARWLSARFKNERVASPFIKSDLPVIPDLAVDTIIHETEELLQRTIHFLRHLLQLDQKHAQWGLFQIPGNKVDSAYDLYGKLKQTEGSILEYYARLQTAELTTAQYTLVNQVITASRYCIRAAKTMKDIGHDLNDFYEAVNDTIHKAYGDVQMDWEEFNSAFQTLIAIQNPENLFEELTSQMKRMFENQQRQRAEIIDTLRKKRITEVEASTLLNVNYEILSAKKSLFRALAHLRLNPSQSDAFEFLPGS